MTADLADRDRLAGMNGIEPSQRHRIAGLGAAALDGLFAANGEDAGDALLLAVARP